MTFVSTNKDWEKDLEFQNLQDENPEARMYFIAMEDFLDFAQGCDKVHGPVWHSRFIV